MKNYHIDLLPGDGIGHEVCPEGVKVIQAAAELLGDFQMEQKISSGWCPCFHAQKLLQGI